MAQQVSTMMLKYAYLKPRRYFGKQCIFEHTRAGVENILPNPVDSANYIQRTRTDRTVQLSTTFATHTVQTGRIDTKDSGVLHVEGGWPKEVNRNDGEAVHRYRRRVEKDHGYASSMMHLIPLMEYHVRQNNAVNVHKNFFDDMIPTPLVKQYAIRIWNSYDDPQKIVRPIRSLSWSPNGSNRLAAAYSFTEFEDQPVDLNTYSYVWDVGNASKPMIALDTSSPMLSLQFNPRDISTLISGHMSGQVCCWDIRVGGKPLHTSHLYQSHGDPATKCLWISSKANTEFFSSSSNGTIMWWDIRFMHTPVSVMVMDLEDPKRRDKFKSVGITALNFEPTMSNKFLVGLVNGLVLNINRKNISPDEKFTMQFECFAGPVHAVDRNPFAPKTFLTIGNWSTKIWSDDVKEGFLVNTNLQNESLTGGCWSKSRGSIFYTTKKNGLVEAFDILSGMQKPLTSIHVCSDSLTAISSHEDGELIAVGSSKGTVYVLECLEGLTTFSREDKARLSYYLEGSSRFEKVLDSRLRELRLFYSSIEEEPEPKPKAKIKAKDDSRGKKKRDDTKKKHKEDKKLKKVRSRRKESFLVDAELSAVQKRYFEFVEEEAAKMEDIDSVDRAAVQSLLELRVVTKSEDQPKEAEKEDPTRERSGRSIRIRKAPPKRRKRSGLAADESLLEMEPIMTVDQAAERGRGARRRSILKSCPMEVCKPEICCKDVMAKRRSPSSRKRFPSEDLRPPTMVTPLVIESKSYQTLAEYVEQIEQPSREKRRNILKQRNYPPNVLKHELTLAKAAIHTWQNQILAGKLSFRTVEKKLEKELQKTIDDLDKLGDKSETLDEVTDPSKTAVGTISARSHFARTGTRRRKSKITLEDPAEVAEREKQERWKELKQKVKEFEANLGARWTYPRISAARRLSGDPDVS